MDGTLSLYSETLDPGLWAKGGKMCFRDPRTGLGLLSHHEEHDRAEREAGLRQAAEARVAELEAIIAGKRG